MEKKMSVQYVTEQCPFIIALKDYTSTMEYCYQGRWHSGPESQCPNVSECDKYRNIGITSVRKKNRARARVCIPECHFHVVHEPNESERPTHSTDSAVSRSVDGGVFRLRGSEREGGSLGRRKARWVPDTHCPRRLLLRDETSKRGRGSRARRRGFRRNGGKERDGE